MKYFEVTMKNKYIKSLAIILIAIFSFNVLAQKSTDDCEEENKQYAGKQLQDAVIACLLGNSFKPPSNDSKSAPNKTLNKESKTQVSKLIGKKDEMRGITFFRHIDAPKNRDSNGLYVYFGKNDNGAYTPLRLVLQYHGSSWLFVEKAWSKIDGETIELPQTRDRMGWDRDNGYGGIWEWSDFAITTESEKAIIKKIAAAKTMTIRYEGKKYYDDKKISKSQINAIKETFEEYEKLTAKK